MSKQKPNKRRFIAGAICPRCSELDKIVNYKLDDENYRECVACGFKDKIHLQSVPRELSTRVKEEAHAVAMPVKILQPAKKNRTD